MPASLSFIFSPSKYTSKFSSNVPMNLTELSYVTKLSDEGESMVRSSKIVSVFMRFAK